MQLHLDHKAQLIMQLCQMSYLIDITLKWGNLILLNAVASIPLSSPPLLAPVGGTKTWGEGVVIYKRRDEKGGKECHLSHNMVYVCVWETVRWAMDFQSPFLPWAFEAFTWTLIRGRTLGRPVWSSILAADSSWATAEQHETALCEPLSHCFQNSGTDSTSLFLPLTRVNLNRHFFFIFVPTEGTFITSQLNLSWRRQHNDGHSFS